MQTRAIEEVLRELVTRTEAAVGIELLEEKHAHATAEWERTSCELRRAIDERDATVRALGESLDRQTARADEAEKEGWRLSGALREMESGTRAQLAALLAELRHADGEITRRAVTRRLVTRPHVHTPTRPHVTRQRVDALRLSARGRVVRKPRIKAKAKARVAVRLHHPTCAPPHSPARCRSTGAGRWTAPSSFVRCYGRRRGPTW